MTARSTKSPVSRLARLIFTVVVVCALVPVGAVRAQEAAHTSTAWSTATGYLGIENFRCSCTVDGGGEGTPRRFVFRSPPVLLGVMSGSPAAGLLRRGDMITHIDGHSLLTTEGARRLAQVSPGDDVNLTVKRGSKTLKVAIRASDTPPTFTVITPEASGTGYVYSYDLPSTPPRASIPPVARTAPGVVPPTPAPDVPEAPEAVWATPAVPVSPATPRGWFGFSIRCNDCGWTRSARPGATPVWESDEPPELSMVSSTGPAGRAGLRVGDKVTHIDGLSILSDQGARRFGRVQPGEKVRLTVSRGSSSLTREVTLGARPEVRAAIAARTPRAAVVPSFRRELRYSGQIENVSVEVWSAGGPAVEKIGDTMVITVGTSVVRIKVDPKKAP